MNAPYWSVTPSPSVSGLFGLLLGGPVGWIAGAAVGAGAGAVAAKVVDLGVPDEWVAWFRDAVQPGTSTLVLLVTQLDREALMAELARFSGAHLVYANLDPAVMQVLTKADPDNKHLVPWAWSFTTVGVNKTKVAKALGNTPMPENAWDLVFKPEYTSKLKSCGIAYLDSPTEIIPVALHYIGKDAYSNDPADYKLATEMLAKVRKDVRLFSSTMIDDIAGGKACVAIGWSGDINIAAERAKENGSKDVIEALLPSTGALIFIDAMGITKDAKHPGNAHAFIDFYLRAENAAAMANEMSYPTGNKAALDKINPEIAGNKTIFVESDYMGKMIPPSSFTNEAREAMATAYNAFKTGKAK